MSYPFDMNLYKAVIVRHIDGDTTVVDMDPGFDIKIRKTVRWYGIDAAEKWTPDGKLALEYVREKMPVGATVFVRTRKSSYDKYGRYIGEFFLTEGLEKSLGSELIDLGWAVPYTGRM